MLGFVDSTRPEEPPPPPDGRRRNGRMLVLVLLIAAIALALFARYNRVKFEETTEPVTTQE